MASADFSLRIAASDFHPQGEISPGKNAHLHRTTAASTPLRLGHESFAVCGPLALIGNAFYAVLVHRLAIYAPRFLPTLGHSYAVALHFARCDQLAAGLPPAGVRPCWAHREKKLPDQRAVLLKSSIVLQRCVSILQRRRFATPVVVSAGYWWSLVCTTNGTIFIHFSIRESNTP
jgi:hypothetical protein